MSHSALISTWSPRRWGLLAGASVCARGCCGGVGGVLVWAFGQYQLIRQDLQHLTQSLAAQVDGDLHSSLRDAQLVGSPAYESCIAPLLAAHQRLPNVHYMYTMVTLKGVDHFVLDTAVYADQLPGSMTRSPSALMEPHRDNSSESRALHAAMAGGMAYVYEDVLTDSYGTFLSAAAPIFRSDGSVEGSLASIMGSVIFRRC